MQNNLANTTTQDQMMTEEEFMRLVLTLNAEQRGAFLAETQRLG